MNAKRSRSIETQQNADVALTATYYLFQIQNWSWTFSFGANEPGDVDGPYWDYRHLQLQCSALGPLKKNVTSASMSLLPMRELNDTDARRKHNSNFVGELQLQRGMLTGSLYLPFDALDSALQMMIADRWHCVPAAADHHSQLIWHLGKRNQHPTLFCDLDLRQVFLPVGSSPQCRCFPHREGCERSAHFRTPQGTPRCSPMTSPPSAAATWRSQGRKFRGAQRADFLRYRNRVLGTGCHHLQLTTGDSLPALLMTKPF